MQTYVFTSTDIDISCIMLKNKLIIEHNSTMSAKKQVRNRQVTPGNASILLFWRVIRKPQSQHQNDKNDVCLCYCYAGVRRKPQAERSYRAHSTRHRFLPEGLTWCFNLKLSLLLVILHFLFAPSWLCQLMCISRATVLLCLLCLSFKIYHYYLGIPEFSNNMFFS